MQYPLFEPKAVWSLTQVSELPDWAGAERVGLDTETKDPNLLVTGPSVRTGGYVVGISFALEDGPSHYLPIRHEAGGNLPPAEVIAYLRDQAARYTGILVGANLNYDLDYLAELGIVFPLISGQRDVQIADPLIYELHDSYSLESIAGRWGFAGKNEAHLRAAAAAYGIKSDEVKGNLWRMPGTHVGPYACDDAALPLRILRRQEKVIDDKDLWRVFNVESRLQPILLRMTRHGVKVDRRRLTEIGEWALHEELRQLDEIKRLTGRRLGAGDVNSKGPLIPLLQDLGVRLGQTEKTKQPKIDKAALDEAQHPVARAIVRARKVNKLRTTFVASIERHLVGDRIHCQYSQIRSERRQGDERGPRWGRISAADPNLQQQPARDDFADRWRSIYIPDDPSLLWTSADFCFSEDTEILTKRGFVVFPDLQATDLVAQYQDGAISYALPTQRQRLKYSGGMVHVRGVHHVDLLMTPNHNCFLLDRRGRQVWIKAHEYAAASSSHRQLQAAVLAGGVDVPERDLVAACAVQADGTWRKTSWRIWVSKQRKIDRLQEHVPYSNSYRCAAKGGQTAFVVRPETVRFLSTSKIFDREALLGMSVASRLFFLRELHLWDGSANYYCTTVKENAEIVQEIAALTGIRANLSCRPRAGKKTLWVVYYKARYATYLKTLPVTTEPYDGPVYCVTMPHSTVVVRRNGRVSITGQSQQEPRLLTHYAEISRLPRAKEMADEYRTNPKADNHNMMTVLIHPEYRGMDPKDAVFDAARSDAKLIFLGLCYGMGEGMLAKRLGLPTYVEKKDGVSRLKSGPEGLAVLRMFHRQVPYVGGMAKKAKDKAERRGYIVTILGRRCHFPRRPDGSYDWTNNGLNRLIQGSAGDQIKLALVAMGDAGLDSQVQVHDEVVGGYPNMEAARAVQSIMEGALKLRVPSRVDLAVGPSWGQAEKVK